VVPMVSYAPLVEITSDKADYEELDRRVAQSFSKITNRSCDRLVDFLAYPKEKGGLGLLMPGFYHDELRRVWASLDVNKGTRDPVELSVDGQALQGKGTYFNRLLTRTHQLPDRAAAYCLQMCGVLTEEERALKERDGSIMAQTRGTCPGCHETRHDRRVPVPPRLGEAQRRAGGQDPQPPQRPEPEARHLARRQVQGDRCGCHPAPPDGCHSEKVKKYRDGALPIIYGTDGSLHPKSKKHLEELHVDLCPGCLRHRPHGCRGERAPDEADQTGRAESLATQSDRLLSSYF
ncbi:Hypothetical protein DHA2_154352, partial [Giardia duodenalis]